MGRWSYSNRQEAGSLKQISASFLNKQGYFVRGWKSGNISWTRNGEQIAIISIQASIDNYERFIKLSYTQTDNYLGERKDFDYKITLTTTPCFFGGERFWFICPLSANGVYCGRRVGTLYKGGDYFGCRHCYSLTYESKNKNRRSEHYPLFATLDGLQKIEELEKKIKVKYYRGKATRKQQRLNMMNFRMLPYMVRVSKMR